MGDLMDRVQAQTEAQLANALEHLARRVTRPGLTHCEDADCREPIAPARTAMGARLCIDCALADEHRVQQNRGRGV
ncbi:DksA/TraR family C4-type zinc finger protein [Pseudoxanthomonas winnipegensis]|uniref:DksA/TraR family C4-type zinc finger protein n=1 Tax=Pseudoxanthomonas winnipegensis TaxID=2480810 RepID=UPI00102DCC55|nr:DksA/TraR family C4-type zinc finger protein [Pseudoxanthomonas winnipegensis]TAA42171.1 DksA/TraR family C4-type zinc finger protein [Pseudoxanthomonas winnipegensis]